VLLVVSAVAAALLLPLSATLAVVAAQALAMVGLRTIRGHGPTDLLPIAEAGIFAGFQLFAVTMVESGLRERRRRSELAALNVELTAAQARLTESTRAAERLRIARDMHDTLGHQLTALAVNLEVASHLVDGPAREPVEQSRLLAKQTLRDVRSAVSQMRDRPTHLDAALSGMFGTVPGLSIHLSVDPSITAGDPARDEALLRCSQEIVTNAIRHADADNVWITISQTDDAILVLGRDDGHGPHGDHHVTAGNGLRGMRERFEQLGGTVNFSAAGGFTVEAKLPAW
jgi:signal transduction histidine kinase